MTFVLTATFVLCLLFSVPIGIVLGLTSLIWIAYLSPDLVILLPQKFLSGINSFPLLAIPLFILAGNIMGHGGIAKRIIEMALVFVGRMPGGLGMVSVISTMFFSGVCGSASADTAAIGSITLPEMKKRKYPPAFSTALMAAAGGTSTLIPPSIDLVIIGIVANISIAGLFAAGLLPALINTVALLILTYIYGRRLKIPLEPKMSMPQKLKTLGNGVFAILMVAIILGGILGGIFTPTEASAVAVIYGFIISFFVYKELKLEDLPKVLIQTCKLTGLVMFMLGMASIFSFILSSLINRQFVGTIISDFSPRSSNIT